MGKHSGYDLVVATTHKRHKELPPIVGFGGGSPGGSESSRGSGESGAAAGVGETNNANTHGANAWRTMIQLGAFDVADDEHSPSQSDEDERKYNERPQMTEEQLEALRFKRERQRKLREQQEALKKLHEEFQMEFPQDKYHNLRYNISYARNYRINNKHESKRHTMTTGEGMDRGREGGGRRGSSMRDSRETGLLLPGYQSPAFDVRRASYTPNFAAARRGHDKDADQAALEAEQRVRKRNARHKAERRRVMDQLIENQPSSLRAMMVQKLLKDEREQEEGNDNGDEDDDDEEEEQDEWSSESSSSEEENEQARVEKLRAPRVGRKSRRVSDAEAFDIMWSRELEEQRRLKHKETQRAIRKQRRAERKLREERRRERAQKRSKQQRLSEDEWARLNKLLPGGMLLPNEAAKPKKGKKKGKNKKKQEASDKNSNTTSSSSTTMAKKDDEGKPRVHSASSHSSAHRGRMRMNSQLARVMEMDE